MKKVFSVYVHKNKINNKVYVGITSTDVEKRWENGNGYRKQYIYNDIKKYGWDNFTHEVLFTNLSLEQAQAKEIELIKKFNSNDERYGYNKTIGGDWLNQDKPTNQYDLDGNFIKTWDSRADVANFLGVGADVISVAIKNKTQSKGFQFRNYCGDINNIKPYSKKLTNTKVNQYDKNGNFIKTWESVKELAKFFNTGSTTIIEYIRENKFYKKDHYFEYYDGNIDNIKIKVKKREKHPNCKKVGKYDFNMNLISIYESAMDAIKENKNNYGIYNCLQNKAKQSCGFIWKYI